LFQVGQRVLDEQVAVAGETRQAARKLITTMTFATPVPS
jgi:hypothetical protein